MAGSFEFCVRKIFVVFHFENTSYFGSDSSQRFNFIDTCICLGVKIKTFLSCFKQLNLLFDKFRIHFS